MKSVYSRNLAPELYAQQNNTLGVLKDFKWREDYQENYKILAVYFKDHPQEYSAAMDFGKRLSKVSLLSENDPEIEILARESAEFIKNNPFLKDMLYDKSGLGGSEGKLYNNMVEKALTPAQMKHKQLLQKFLNHNI